MRHFLFCLFLFLGIVLGVVAIILMISMVFSMGYVSTCDTARALNYNDVYDHYCTYRKLVMDMSINLMGMMIFYGVSGFVTLALAGVCYPGKKDEA